jgi:hypothetical protein
MAKTKSESGFLVSQHSSGALDLVREELERIHTHLARLFLHNVSQVGSQLLEKLLAREVDSLEVLDLQELVDAATPMVQVGPPKDVALKYFNVPEKDWEITELQRNISQIAVLVEALRLPELDGSIDVKLHPTQSGDKSECDANGKFEDNSRSWIIEAYGGRDITNNEKIREDVTKLNATKASSKWFVCRVSAIPPKSKYGKLLIERGSAKVAPISDKPQNTNGGANTRTKHKKAEVSVETQKILGQGDRAIAFIAV